MQFVHGQEEKNGDKVGAAITERQTLRGEHFSDVQNGHYSSQQVAEIMRWTLLHGAAGVGQTSWGTTGFAVYANELKAYQTLQLLRKNWQNEKNLDFCLCTARNTKADIIIDGQLPQDINLQSHQ